MHEVFPTRKFGDRKLLNRLNPKMWSQTFICLRIFARKNIFQMIFDIGIFGGGEESSSFTQERFTDHEGGRSLSLVFQFTSHLLTFSKYVFFSHTNPFLPGRFCLTISYSIVACVKTKLILEKESDSGGNSKPSKK